MATADDYSQAELVRMLSRLEEGQARIEHRLEQLPTWFVGHDVYEADQRTAAEQRTGLQGQVDALKSEVGDKAGSGELASVRAVSMWALGLVATVCFSAIILGLLTQVVKHP